MVAACAGIPRCTAIAEIRLALRAWVAVSTTLRPFTFVVHSPALSSFDDEERVVGDAVPDPAHHEDERDHDRGGTPHDAHQFWCSASLRATPPARHGTTSTVPVTELRRKSRWLPPERSSALTTPPSGRVTLVPAVT